MLDNIEKVILKKFQFLQLVEPMTRGARVPPYFGQKKKKGLKRKRPGGQENQDPPPPSLAQGLDPPLS